MDGINKVHVAVLLLIRLIVMTRHCCEEGIADVS